MRRPIIAIALLLGCASAGALERYLIDTEGMHAAIEFRIQHLGYSWLSGRFNTFSGWFEFDHALVAVGDQRVEDAAAREQLARVFLDPQPRAHLQRQWQEHLPRLRAGTQVQVIPQIAMRQVLMALRLEHVVVVGVAV